MLLGELTPSMPGKLPENWESMDRPTRLEHVLGCTITGAALIASCYPLTLLPAQLAIWDRVRWHLWNIALTERHRAEDKEALAALSERFGNVPQNPEGSTEQKG